MKLAVILWGIPQAMRVCAMFYPKFKERLKERDAIAQFAIKEDPTKGRWVQLKDGRITTGAGIHASQGSEAKHVPAQAHWIFCWRSRRHGLLSAPYPQVVSTSHGVVHADPVALAVFQGRQTGLAIAVDQPLVCTPVIVPDADKLGQACSG